MAKTLFPDTNVFLHCRPIQEIDWTAVCDDSPVKLIVCLQVVDELDSFVHDPRHSDRARQAHTDIDRATANEVRANVTLDYFNPTSDPPPDSMDPSKFDNRIVFSAVRYKQLHPDEDVAIVTRDKGMVMRCKTYGIDCIKVDSKHHLAPPTDETTKKLRQVQAEVARLQNRLPGLFLSVLPKGGFPDPTEDKPAKLRPTLYEQRNLSQLLDDARLLCPAMEDRGFLPHSFHHYPPGAVHQYNYDVQRYYEAIEKWADEYNHWAAAQKPRFDLELYLSNYGSCPATGIEIELVMLSNLDGFSRYEEPKTPIDVGAPAFPTPPKKPDPLGAIMAFRPAALGLAAAGRFLTAGEARDPLFLTTDPQVAGVAGLGFGMVNHLHHG